MLSFKNPTWVVCGGVVGLVVELIVEVVVVGVVVSGPGPQNNP